ncbi:MAG: hypothetical protein LBL39_01060 [Planctomycetaceae bacterium]|jgi:hypothetical protein|nr:hypothetical protein [Planctomycetaceae bacterium]
MIILFSNNAILANLSAFVASFSVQANIERINAGIASGAKINNEIDDQMIQIIGFIFE